MNNKHGLKDLYNQSYKKQYYPMLYRLNLSERIEKGCDNENEKERWEIPI